MELSDIYLPLHLMTLAFVAYNILRADHLGFAWISGRISVMNEREVRKYHVRVWAGLVGMIATGFLMFWPMREYLLNRPQFYIKMSCVLALVANGFVIGYLQKVALAKSFAELTTREKLPLIISGAVSTLSWLGAAAMAFFIVEEFN